MDDAFVPFIPEGRALTAEHRCLRDRLEQALGALPVIESRRDTVKTAALFLAFLSKLPLLGEDVTPTIAEQAQRDELLKYLGPHLRFDNSSSQKDALLFLHSASGFLRGEDNPRAAKQAERELRALRKLAAVLSDRRLPDDLIAMEVAAQRVLEQSRARPGRPRKQRADWVTLLVASVFTQLTGTLPTLCIDPRKATAYGPFIDLLSAVFAICNIAASPEARARDFIRKFCRPRREHGPL